MRHLKNIASQISISFLFILFLLFPRIVSSGDRPSVMFMIAEQNIGVEIPTYWWSQFSVQTHSSTLFSERSTSVDGVEVWRIPKNQRFDLSVGETILKEAFLNEGFNVIDIASVGDKIKVSEAYGLLDITKKATLEIGKDVGADVVVTGKIIARRGPTETGSNVGTYMADVTATAFQVKDGLVLASGRADGVSRHISEITGGSQAIEKASQKLAKKMIEQIDAKIGQ